MTTTPYCRDYGGSLGLTCGYWVSRPDAIDRHIMKHHRTEAVYDLERDPSQNRSER